MAKFSLTNNVYADMINADYWLDTQRDTHATLVNDVEKCNVEIAKACSHIVDIYSLETYSSADTVRTLIGSYPFPENEVRYNAEGKELESSFYDSLRRNQNLANIQYRVDVSFAVTVRKTFVRAFPTWESSALRLDNLDFDRFQECEHDALTPVAILHTSADGLWSFARTPIYFGWMPSVDLAIVANSKALREWCEPGKFLLIVGSIVKSACGKNQFMMGTRLPLLGNGDDGFYSARAPVRSSAGFVEESVLRFFVNEDVKTSYLPFTLHNQFHQLFKMIGEPYSWGGRSTGRDCTRVILDTFRCFGIVLPRNSGEQRLVGVEQLFRKTGIEQTDSFDSAIGKLALGTLLYSDGHAMTFLGTRNQRHYIIHSFSGYQHIEGPSGESVHGMNVTELSIIRGGIGAVKWARRI